MAAVSILAGKEVKKEQLWATAAMNALVLEELRRLDEIFSQPFTIPVMVLKGGALAFTLYSDSSLRPVSDLDLLVPKELLQEALARLKDAGYSPVAEEMAPGLNLLLDHHFDLMREGLPFGIEVHWTLTLSEHERYHLDMAWFWEHAEPLRLPFPNHFLTLDPTAHLLYIAAHTMLQHGEAQMDPKWLYDLHLLVEKEGERIDWEELARQAAASRWSEAVLRALRRCVELLGTQVPEEAFHLLEEGRDRTVAKLLERKAKPRRKGEKAWEKLHSLDWTGRLGLLRGLLFPSPAFVRWRYRPNPSWTWPFFYPYRWFDILREGFYLAIRAIRACFRSGER
jgi:hypothetical protein